MRRAITNLNGSEPNRIIDNSISKVLNESFNSQIVRDGTRNVDGNHSIAMENMKWFNFPLTVRDLQTATDDDIIGVFDYADYNDLRDEYEPYQIAVTGRNRGDKVYVLKKEACSAFRWIKHHEMTENLKKTIIRFTRRFKKLDYSVFGFCPDAGLERYIERFNR